jgi:hypothetical protein
MHDKEELEGFCDGFSGTILGAKCASRHFLSSEVAGFCVHYGSADTEPLKVDMFVRKP